MPPPWALARFPLNTKQYLMLFICILSTKEQGENPIVLTVTTIGTGNLWKQVPYRINVV